MIYGTAWKEEKTEVFVRQALEAGFRAIDTANQRKHYYEEGVGRAIQEFLKTKKCMRSDLFIQTKFTFARGQDHRKPYDESASYADQVRQSFKSSLEHLGLSYLDSLVLHGPYYRSGIGAEDLEAWGEMEKLFEQGHVKALGVSNIDRRQLERLCEVARVKPKYVQNRCFAVQGWDFEAREFCNDNGLLYQGFSLLTANRTELSHPQVLGLARKYGKSVPQIIFRFSIQVGMIPLTGTTSTEHLKQDLDIEDFTLSPSEIEDIEWIAQKM